jgi:hypothetical protein
MGITFFLEKTGFRWTLRVYALFLLTLGGLATLGTKPRVPVAAVSREPPVSIDFRFVKNPLFVTTVSPEISDMGIT